MRCMFKAVVAAFALNFSANLAMPATAQQSQIEIFYEEPSNVELRPTYERLKRGAILEKLREFLSPLRLPRKLTVRTAQCDAPTRPYERGGPITVCYELMDKVARLVAEHSKDLNDQENFDEESLINAAFVESTLHQTALAIFDILEVPIWGREFDAADRLAAFVMTQFGEDAMRTLILNTTRIFEWSDRTWTGQDFASTASPQAQRFYNYLCTAYAGDPLGFSSLVPKTLPDWRAGQCEREYEQVKQAFNLRIMPFVDPDLLVKVKATQWLNRTPG